MPSKAKVSFRRRREVLKKLPIFYPNGDLKLKNNIVWTEARRKLKNDIEIHNLYISVFQDRNGILSYLQDEAGFSKKSKQTCDTDSSDESDDSDEEGDQDVDIDFDFDRLKVGDKNPHDCPPLNFSICLNKAEYGKIKPIEVFYKNNQYPVRRLNYGWSDVLVRKICSSTRLKCAFSMKKQTVYKNEGLPFFDFYGHCRECGTYIYGSCDRKYSNEADEILVQIETFDTTEIPHKKKRFLKGKSLKKARNTLTYVKATTYRKKVRRKFFKFGDPEPADLQTTITLRKARERAVSRELNVQSIKDVYSALKFLANQPDTSIHHLQDKPFILKFHTKNQITLWKNIAKKGRMCVSMDASGTFVKPICTPTHETNYLLFYVVITVVDAHIIPLQQMITEKHDTNTIKSWLSDVFRLDVPAPDEVYTDGCLALIGAGCLTWNKCSYPMYIDNGFQYCLREKLGLPQTIKLYKTWMRQDRAHIMKASARWSCFRNKKNEVKDTYLRIIGYCFEIESLKLLEDVLFALFILAESKFIVPNAESQRQLNWMMNCIKTFDRKTVHEILEKPSQADSKTLNYHSDDEFKQIVDNSNINIFIQNIYDKSLKECNNEVILGATTNSLRCPDIKNNIFYLFAQAPSWTNLLRQAHNSPNVKAVSAGVEAYFKDLKNLDWVTYPISAHKFVKNQEEQIEATVAFAQSELMDQEVIRKYEASQKKLASKKIDKEKPIKLIKKKPILKNNLSSNFIGGRKENPMSQNSLQCASAYSTSEDVVILNGNLKEKSPVKIKEQEEERSYITNNTCPIDSLCEIFSYAYENIESLKTIARQRSRNNDFLNAIQSYCEQSCIKDYIYQRRAELMKPIAISVVDSKIYCQFNVSELLELFFTRQPLITRKISCDNLQCTYERTDGHSTAIIPVPKINDFRAEGMTCLEYYLSAHFTIGNAYCSACKMEKRNNIYKIDTILAVNVEYLFLNEGKVVDANSVPAKLNILDKNYTLAGLVAFRELKNSEVTLHYFSYLFKDGVWEKRDDLINKVDTMKILPKDIKISLIVYIVD